MLQRVLVCSFALSLAGALASANVAPTASGATTPTATVAMPEIQAASDACLAAIPGYESAVTANPGDATSHNRLGVCYQRTGRLADAIGEYRAAVKANARLAEAWNNLGTAYHGDKQLSKAIKQYKRAIQLRPELATAHRNLGLAFLAQGNNSQGLTALRHALELNPAVFETSAANSFIAPSGNLATQYFYFAKLSAAAGQVDSALEFLRKAQAAGFRDFEKVREDGDFKAVVSDARFATLASK
jgi:tetratricopeptide (TPR) repeat protein